MNELIEKIRNEGISISACKNLYEAIQKKQFTQLALDANFYRDLFTYVRSEEDFRKLFSKDKKEVVDREVKIFLEVNRPS